MSSPVPRINTLARFGVGCVLLLVALWRPGVSLGAESAPAGRQAMADAMSRMMESMGLLGGGNGTGAGAGAGAGADAGSWDQAGEVGRRLMEGLGKAGPGGGLDGVWEVAGGGLLIVQGGNYRLYAPDGGFVDGVIQISGPRVRMASRRARFALEFEYAQDQGRLVMRDARGQIYLYRRLLLNGGG